MSLGGTGMRDWVVQRYTAYFLLIYTLLLGGGILYHSWQGTFTYGLWHQWFSHPVMQIATLGALVCMAWHAWVGLWTVLTDYVTCSCLRAVCKGVILFVLFGYLVWGMLIVWGAK